MSRTAITLLFCVGVFLSSLAQVRKIDTLLGQLGNHPQEDQQRVALLIDIGQAYLSIDPQKTASYAQEVLRIAEKLDYRPGLSAGHQLMGLSASAQGEYPAALESFLIALSLQRKIGDQRGISQTLNHLAEIYYHQENWEKALHYNQQALEVSREQADIASLANAYLAQGMMQASLQQRDQALEAYRQALELFEGQGDSLRLASTYGEIGQMFMQAGRRIMALRYYQDALAISRQLGDRSGTAATLLRMARIYLVAGQLETAEKLAQEGLALAQRLSARNSMLQAYQIQAEIDSLRGNYRSALTWYSRLATLKDSVYHESRSQQLAELELRYRTEQNQQQAELRQKEKALSELRLASQQTTIQNHRLLLGGIILLLLLLVAGLGLLYRLHLAKQDAYHQLTQQQAEIQQQQAELEALNRSKDQWFSILGHDFRYPLHFLQHALSLINDGNLSEREQVMLTRELEQRARNAGNLLDNLLYWAQGQLDEISLSPSYLNLHELVEESLAYLAHHADKKGVMISNDVPPTLYAWADADTMQLVIRNLLENAIKYSSRGGVIRVKGAEAAEEVSLMVEDQGIGMDEEVRAKLFRLEQPYSSPGTAREAGTGMGLILSRDILHRNKGRILVESEPGQGSTFTLRLPRSEQLAKSVESN
jgi:two-component system, sensor histidine kinase and response regulator